MMGPGPGGRDDMSRGNSMMGGSGSMMGGSADMGETFGLSPQFLDRLGIDGEIHTRIFISNMDYKVDEKKLREIFKYAGRVCSVQVSIDKEGKSRGFGTVVFDHPVEAVQAIAMFNNQNLYDRPMRIRIDKVKVDNDQKVLSRSRLPEGLGGVGMGLGRGGQPLMDVREAVNNAGAGGGDNGANMGGGNMNMGRGGAGGGMGDNMNLGANALQTALATIASLAGNLKPG